MTVFEPAIPRLVPPGHYVCEIAEEPTRKPSSFDSGYYYVVELYLRDKMGQTFQMTKNFRSNQDIFHEFLRAVGGQTQPNGVTLPPKLQNWKGLKFEADVIKRPSRNDKDRMVNDLVNITPYKEETQTATENTSDSDKNEDDEVPF